MNRKLKEEALEKETCHASESWHPEIIMKRWMPAFAGMTPIIFI